MNKNEIKEINLDDFPSEEMFTAGFCEPTLEEKEK